MKKKTYPLGQDHFIPDFRLQIYLFLKALDTIGNPCEHKNLLVNDQWRAVDSTKHCEKT